jgi:hypothetical protein
LTKDIIPLIYQNRWNLDENKRSTEVLDGELFINIKFKLNCGKQGP